MKLSELVNFNSNFIYLNEIKKNRENIIPFVGAGISKGCGLYTWGELLHKLATEYLTVEEIGALEKKGNFFDFADKIVSVSGNSDIIMKKIRTIFSESKVCLTELPFLIVSMFSPMIITTNYDTLLEDASANSPLGYLRPLLPCLVGQMNEAIQMNERRLLKLHGSIEETQSFVFTTEQYNKVYGNKGKRGNRFLPFFLKKIFSGKKVLFLGCSLEQDRTLEILEECVKKNHSITHYAILPYFSDSIKQIKRNSILSKYGIEPIFYPEGDFQAVNKLLIYLSEENHFIISIRSILEKIEDSVEIQILISILKECYYKTSIRFPGLLDIDNVKNDFTEDILKSIGTSRNQTDTVLNICREAFSAYVKLGFLHYQKETISFFNEQLMEEALIETEIAPLLQKKWSIPRNLTNIKDLNLSWITALDDNEINNFANELLEKLQYRNGMSFIDIGTSYNMAKSLIDCMEERINFEIRIKLLNSIGAFGHFFQDSDAALTYLEKAIHAIDMCGNTSRQMMLLKAKCYANLAITKSLSSTDLRPVIDAAEKDIFIKREYNESPMLYSRSLNFYATVLKEVDPFKACDIYIEVVDVKKEIAQNAQDSEQIKELTASWATTIFNIGLLAKDLELYETAYKIVQYANQYRFKTVDYCNRDYCNSVNVYAELELFVQEKRDIEMLINGIESRLDLPNGFAETLTHTWYVTAYYYYLKQDYHTALKYATKSIGESNKKGALVDFRQRIKLELLLADVKEALRRNTGAFSNEAISIVMDVVDRVGNLYGQESYYLILPYRHLVRIVGETAEAKKYKKTYNELVNKYITDIRNAEAKLEQFIENIEPPKSDLDNNG
ncbi:MAG: hypothetical protein HDT43_00340 [Ruminococcaceae bacterium]|nr:hypothetical protein [Oscillospiraceae bacterium]